jgi:competence protein ComEC
LLRVAGTAWLGCLIGLSGSWTPGLLALAAATALLRRHARAAVLCGVLAAGVLSGAVAHARAAATFEAPLPASGPLDVAARVVADPVLAHFGGSRLLVATTGDPAGGWPPPGVRLIVESDGDPAVTAGDVIRVRGLLRDRPGRLRGDPYRATVTGAEVARIAGPTGPFFALGNRLRALILDRLVRAGGGSESALLAGFLVGETNGLPESDLENLQRSGLTHFVAVSGSNVALFLGAWWLVAGPLRLSPRLRATGGLIALGVFVVATRWEPSVIRAATMAGFVLAGRMVELPVDAWRALALAVVALLLTSGDLATDIGFQLSVAATAGVMIGARLAGPKGRRGWVRTTLIATAGAQVAVLPILLLRFATVPLMSPLANLLAAPLVTAATAVGGVGLLLDLDPLLRTGLAAARGVLFVADHAAGWPQVGALGAAIAIGAGVLLRVRTLRPAVALAALVLLVGARWPVGPPDVPVITFLDVGQGDAILIRDPSGATALVDGGRDPLVLRSALRRQGVRDVDLLVVTHGDADHVGGLVGIGDILDVGVLWYPGAQSPGDILPEVIEAAEHTGTAAVAVASGHRVTMGGIEVQVLGPRRRYATENDGSIVLWVAAGSATALLTGDVEAIGQEELPLVRPDILQVPHHGSATTSLKWLVATVGDVAVVSVGPNTYGHPDPDVLAALDAAGTSVHTTQGEGDVTIRLCDSCRAVP